MNPTKKVFQAFFLITVATTGLSARDAVKPTIDRMPIVGDTSRVVSDAVCTLDLISMSGFDVRSGTAIDLHRFGEAGWQVPMDMATDKDGSLVIVGNFDGSLDFGAPASVLVNNDADDIFIVKLDRCGTPIWARSFGDDQAQSVQRVAIDKDGNILLVGYFSGAIDFGGGALVSAGGRDVFVAKFDAAGEHVWSQRFGDAGDQFGRGIATDSQGNVFLAGSFWGDIDLGGGVLSSAGWEDIFLAKFDSQGQHIWSKRFGDAETQEAWDIATDEHGNVALTGYVLGTVDFGNGSTTGAGMPDAILVKFDGEGIALWSHRFGDAGHQFGQSVAIDSHDSIVITGEMDGIIDFGDGPYFSAGGYDVFAAKFDALGHLVWHREFGDAADQPSIVATIGHNDDILVAGMFDGGMGIGDVPLVSAGSFDAFVARLDGDGNVRWARGMGDDMTQAGTAIVADINDRAVVAGKMFGSIDIDGLSVNTENDSDLSLFLAHFSP